MRGLAAGLCSVTFRDRSVGEVIELAAAAGLDRIEWGGDRHVPHGDLRTARLVGASTRAAGLEVCSYGSYLFALSTDGDELRAVLDTACALGAPTVRVWSPPVEAAPKGGGRSEEPGGLGPAARSLAAIARAARERGLRVYLEFHGGTLTSAVGDALALLDLAGDPDLLCGWQPPYWEPRGIDREVSDIALLGARLGHVHVYSWEPDTTRRALGDQRAAWRRRLLAAGAPDAPPGFERCALIEFVRGDDPAQFVQDAAVLRALLAERGAGLVAGEGIGP
ncbi:MAG: TIM barrel protein [Microthrixaceae bacterium]